MIAIAKRTCDVHWYFELAKNIGYKNWVQNYLILVDLKKEYSDLKRRHSECRQASMTISELREKFEKTYWGYHDRYVGRVADLIVRTQNAPDPFARVERLLGRHYLENYISPSVMSDSFEKIEKDLGAGYGISKEEREKTLSDLEAQMEPLKARIAELSPAQFFPIVRGSAVADIREDFVREWRSTQSAFNSGCNPCFVQINNCHPDEQWAYRELNISRFINHTTAQSPAPEPGYRR